MDLYLIRHGETAGDPHQHHTPPVRGCLSPRGQQQATALAAALSDVRFDRVFASPLGRAIQTAQPLAERSGVDIDVLDWLIEWRPAPEMMECDDAAFEAMQEEANRLRPEQSWKTFAGEGALEMAHRVICGFVELMTTLSAPPGHGGYLLDDPDDERQIALVAHGGSLGRLAAFLLGVPIQPFAPIAFEETGVAVFRLVRRVDVWYPALRVPAPTVPEPDAVPSIDAAAQHH